MPDLLIELLSEEIPARMQAAAAADFRRLFREGLNKARLEFSLDYAWVTPRRLTLVVEGLPARQPDVVEERKGPRVGAPEAAIGGFLRATGLSALAQAEVRETAKGSFYFAVSERPGLPTEQVVDQVLGDALTAMPWPKSMRWGAGAFRWVRPVHGVLVVFDGAPVPFALDFGGVGDDGETRRLEATNRTVGHRFLAPREFEVVGPADYHDQLEEHKVVVDQDRRRRMIAQAAHDLAAAEGLSINDDPALLDEVTGLVEWPVVLMGRIDAAFMDLPREVLITAMRTHQKYFSVVDRDGRLAPRFVVVANTETADDGRAVIAGNERVLRARLSDARFFWQQDRAKRLDARVPKLKERVFHARLGSDFERTERLVHLARLMAPMVGAEREHAARAALLAKADLTTGLVGEFPELQGTMGRYYALHDGEAPEVADAIAEHYSPLGPSDRCPSAPVAVAVALADKFDTLAGFFAIGEKPTGSKDPFALRRAALGVIRIVVENGLRLRLRDIFHDAGRRYGLIQGPGAADRLAADLLEFFADRLKVHLKERGVRHDLIAAVFAAGAEDDLVRLLARVDALRDFLDTDDGANLLVAYRRASNIVRIEENKDRITYDGEVQPERLSQAEEQTLFAELTAVREGSTRALADERFADAMAMLAGLRRPVDAFFDHVTVNCPAVEIRANRLKLLSQIRSALGGVADFSLIEG
jgi:glycyl-tRNA synthetase beta chain